MHLSTLMHKHKQPHVFTADCMEGQAQPSAPFSRRLLTVHTSVPFNKDCHHSKLHTHKLSLPNRTCTHTGTFELTISFHLKRNYKGHSEKRQQSPKQLIQELILEKSNCRKNLSPISFAVLSPCCTLV